MVDSVQTYALHGATVIDGHGGAPLRDAVILVENGTIKEVGSRESLKVGADISKIDVEDHFILPGLIDAHVHMVGVGSPELLDNIVESNYLQAMRTVVEAGKLLEYGFTTIRSAGSRYDIFLKRAIEEGTVIGPRILTCGLALCRSRGGMGIIFHGIYMNFLKTF